MFDITYDNTFTPEKCTGFNFDDDICGLCGNLCSSNSSCSKRYNLLYGCFNDSEYTDDWAELTYGPDSIPVCDKCMTHHNIEECEEINILAVNCQGQLTSRSFQIDTCVRVND